MIQIQSKLITNGISVIRTHLLRIPIRNANSGPAQCNLGANDCKPNVGGKPLDNDKRQSSVDCGISPPKPDDTCLDCYPKSKLPETDPPMGWCDAVHEGYAKLKAKQAKYQNDDCLPVFLKLGKSDKNLFQLTSGIAVVGLGLVFKFFYDMIVASLPVPDDSIDDM